ncbi:MAG: hypothetical protein H0X65_03760, partial [Gemmatimonadetes bacterium]|nr:hypothetical protein [Gemmatimonadota bacterium]
MSAASAPSVTEVERALAEVYARAEFSVPTPSPFRVWLGDAWAALREWFGSLLPGISVSEGGARAAYWVAAGILVIVAVGVILHFA